jgi:vanillate O-demethylase monooxygenase subunit
VPATAFLRNQWYCAGWAASLSKPVGIQMLGEHVVIYADPAGQPIAVSGRCPHRFAPLERGRVFGDRIMCPYHGLQFGRDGQCVMNPTGPVPPRARLRTYPVVIRNRALWVWMGDASRADESRLPAEGFVTSPAYASSFMYLKVHANYQLVVDNLLDLNHVPFVHASTLALPTDGPPLIPRHEFSMDGESIHSNYYISGIAPNPRSLSLFEDKRADFSAEMTWRAPANLALDVWLRPIAGSRATPLHQPTLHYLTPESDTVTHYFVALGRNLKIDDKSEDEISVENLRRAFVQEDEPMLRACQQMMGTTDLFSLDPVILKADIAAVQARRAVSKLLAAEQSQTN